MKRLKRMHSSVTAEEVAEVVRWEGACIVESLVDPAKPAKAFQELVISIGPGESGQVLHPDQGCQFDFPPMFEPLLSCMGYELCGRLGYGVDKTDPLASVGLSSPHRATSA